MATASGTGDGSSSSKRHQNRLAQEKSPYLLQHASNPVDWYPWGKEALDKAKRENKPIFLSVGYSTCHWCHVMERESFENEEIGKIMNEHFVCIKVDREERPDVDKVYMTFIQATRGGGGWPMSVWLTPDLKPIVGGTYFPPDDRYFGRPGFKTVLMSIAKQWQQSQEQVQEQGTMILDALTQGTVVRSPEGQTMPGVEPIQKCYSMLASSYDPDKGGFGKAPKFPQPVNFNFMFRFHAQNPDSEEGKKALEMSQHTLRMMAKGGMHDHVAQGFHRYSTDNDWHVPHFEKMLYDQAQLAVSYIDAYQITKLDLFEYIARGILKYVTRDLSDKGGGFYSAEDADSYPTHDAPAKKEGAFCVWSEPEVRDLLSAPLEGHGGVTLADVFCYHYDVRKDGNVNPYQDPHDELKQQNVLIVRGSMDKTSARFGLNVDSLKQTLRRCRELLAVSRKKRPAPHLDNKMLTAWNGLMISGFARAGQVLSDPIYTHRAIEAAQFLKAHMYQQDTGILLRSAYAGEKDTVTQIPEPIQGFADDYAFLIRGLLDLYEACYDDSWLEWAEKLQEKQDELFWDPQHGGYFNSDAKDASIVLRMKEDQDGAEPSANSVSAMNLLRMANYLNRSEWRGKAVKLMTAFGERLVKVPLAVPEMVCALMFYHSTPKQIIIVGDREGDDTQAMLNCVHTHYLPNKILILADGKQDGYLYKKLPMMKSLEKLEGKATAHVCHNYTCSLPTNDIKVFEKLLTGQDVG